MRTLCSILATLTLLVMIAPIHAEDAVPAGGDAPKKEHAKGGIAAIDVNQDGVISADELAAVTNEKMKAKLTAADTDADGSLSVDELAALNASMMKKEGEPKKEKKEKKPKEEAAPAAE